LFLLHLQLGGGSDNPIAAAREYTLILRRLASFPAVEVYAGQRFDKGAAAWSVHWSCPRSCSRQRVMLERPRFAPEMLVFPQVLPLWKLNLAVVFEN